MVGVTLVAHGIFSALDALDGDEKEDFFDAYSALVQKAYPQRADGKTLYPFRRVFIVARK